MQADPDERISERASSGPPMVPILAGIVILVALAVWLFTGPEEAAPPAEPPPPVVEPDPAPVVEPEPPPAPDIPQQQIPEPAPEPEPDPAPAEPPLTLDKSDEPLREVLAPVLPAPLAPALELSNLMDRGVALVDGLSRGVIPRKVLPLPPPRGKFPVRKTAGQAYMDPAGYRRYDAYAEAIAALDTPALAAAFHRFRPLLEEAYGYLGYKPGNLDNAVISALDNIIAAPVVSETLPVKQVEAVYKFTDPEYEQLPALQKQLLRMGPENTRRIQGQATALRAALLQQP